MTSKAFYNEIDPFAAQWLKNLRKAGHIAPGKVSTRDIRDLESDDLRGRTQVHLFAGIGVWSYALRQAGWPDDLEVWTGSCPCQPFSNAGKGGGFEDERHLWPEMFRLICECHPNIIFGEQVASKDGLYWFDLVSSQMEDKEYTIGAVDICLAGLGAPEIRQRLYWVAIANEQRSQGFKFEGFSTRKRFAGKDGLADRLANPNRVRCIQGSETTKVLGYGNSSIANGGYGRPGPTNGYWRNADWLFCTDGFWRPVEPGTFPLVDGVIGRVGQLRAYGNAIAAPQAQVFIEAVMEVLGIEPEQYKRIKAR